MNLKLEPVIYDYIHDKIGNLDKFIANVDSSAVKAWVEVDLTTKHHQSGNIYRTKAQIRLPAGTAVAEAIDKDIFLTIDAVKEKLQEELEKYKQKKEALHKRGARALKKLLRFSPLSRWWRKGRIRDEGI